MLTEAAQGLGRKDREEAAECLGSPDQQAINRIWQMIVAAFAIVFVGSSIALMAAVSTHGGYDRSRSPGWFRLRKGELWHAPGLVSLSKSNLPARLNAVSPQDRSSPVFVDSRSSGK